MVRSSFDCLAGRFVYRPANRDAKAGTMSDQPDDRLNTLPTRPARRGRRDRAAGRTADQAPPDEGAGLTVADVAARLRVSPDKVRKWIERGELVGINTAAT